MSPTDVRKMEEGLQWVLDKEIPVVIIGGFAVVHYLATPRTLTPDLDFMVLDLGLLIAKLDAHNQAYKFMMRDKTEIIGIAVKKFNIDFLTASNMPGKYLERVFVTPHQGLIGVAILNIISPEYLVLNKLVSGRDKDDRDAFLLLQSGIVIKDKFKEMIHSFRKELNKADTYMLYAEMIP